MSSCLFFHFGKPIGLNGGKPICHSLCHVGVDSILPEVKTNLAKSRVIELSLTNRVGSFHGRFRLPSGPLPNPLPA
jgi:hypothetical protein